MQCDSGPRLIGVLRWSGITSIQSVNYDGFLVLPVTDVWMIDVCMIAYMTS